MALFTNTYNAAVPILRKTQHSFGAGMSETEQLRWMWGGTVSAMSPVGRRKMGAAFETDTSSWSTETGALGDLEIALGRRGQMHVFAGELASAAGLSMTPSKRRYSSPVAPLLPTTGWDWWQCAAGKPKPDVSSIRLAPR